QIALQASGATASTTLTLADTQSTNQTLTFPNIAGADTVATLGLAQTFTAANIFRAASQTFISAATQDAIKILPRAGGSGSFIDTITTGTLANNATLTIPATTSTDTFAMLGTNNSFTGTLGSSGVTTVSNSTAATNATTGALVVTGGI